MLKHIKNNKILICLLLIVPVLIIIGCLGTRGTYSKVLKNGNNSDRVKAQKAIATEAYAFYYRGRSFNYDNNNITYFNGATPSKLGMANPYYNANINHLIYKRRSSYLYLPEEATPKDTQYLVCSEFIINTYRNSFVDQNGNKFLLLVNSLSENDDIITTNDDEDNGYEGDTVVWGTFRFMKVANDINHPLHALTIDYYDVEEKLNELKNPKAGSGKEPCEGDNCYSLLQETLENKFTINYLKNKLQPGDVIVYRARKKCASITNCGKSNGGHIMLYVGYDENGTMPSEFKDRFVLHSTGSSYNFTSKYDSELNEADGTVQKLTLEEALAQYVLNNERKLRTEIAILRPLDAVLATDNYSVSENTTTRSKMSQLVRTKIASVNEHESVNRGDKITYTFRLENKSTNETYSNIKITDIVPAQTKYVESSCTLGCIISDGKNISWKSISIAPGETKEYSYTVEVNSKATLGSKIESNQTVMADIAMNKITTTVNKTLTKEMQNNLLKRVKDTLVDKQYSSDNAGLDFIKDAYDGVANINFGNNDEIQIQDILQKFYTNYTSSSKNVYILKSNIVNDNFTKMYVKGLFGGYYTTRENQYSLTVNYNVVNGQQPIISDERELTYDDNTLMIGDVILVHNSNYAEESYAYSEYSAYLCLGYNASKEVVQFATIDADKKVKILSGKLGQTNRSRLLESLPGQDAFIVLRPSYAFNGDIPKDTTKPKYTIVSETRSTWQKSQTFKIRLFDDESGLRKGTYKLNYLPYIDKDKVPECSEIHANGVTAKIKVTENGAKYAETSDITISKGTFKYIAFCDINEIIDIEGNVINSDHHYGWNLFIDNKKPVVDIVSDTASEYLNSQTFNIAISDEDSGLKSGTYHIKYAYGTSTSGYNCDSPEMTNNIELDVSKNGIKKVMSNDITINSGNSTRIYICNVDAITDVVGNSQKSNTVVKKLYVDASEFGLYLAKENVETGITNRNKYLNSQTFKFYVSDSYSGLVGGNYKIKYKLYTKSGDVPTCEEMTDYVMLNIEDGTKGYVYSDTKTISSGDFDYIAYCSDQAIGDKAGNIREANKVTKGYNMRIDNTSPKSAIVGLTRSNWQKSQTFSLGLIDDGGGLKGGTYTLKYKLYDKVVPLCDDMTEEISITVNDGDKEVFSNEITVDSGNYMYIAWCNKNDITDMTGNTRQVGSIHPTAYKMLIDNTAPEISLSSTNNLKISTQTAMLSCTDNYEITSYYWDKAEPTEMATFEAAPAELSNGSGIVKTIDVDGTYYFACKDAAGNVTVDNVAYYKYTVDNRVISNNGLIGRYTSNNYVSDSKKTYLAKYGTPLPLASIYTIPEHSNASKFKGASLGTASKEPVELDNQDLLLDNNRTYTMWFDKYTVSIQYNVNGGELVGHAEEYNVDEDGYITRNDSRILQTINYGGSLGIYGLYDYNGSYINITKEGQIVRKEHWCLRDSDKCYNQEDVYQANDFCDAANDDCMVTLDVKWIPEDTPIELELNFGDLNVDEKERIIKRLSHHTTVSELLSKIVTNAVISVIDIEGNDLAGDHIVNSIDRIKIVHNEEEFIYTITILGDVNADGIIDNKDIKKLIRYILNDNSDIGVESLLLGDMNNDGKIRMNDVIKLLKSL